jgi:hypothetical protein
MSAPQVIGWATARNTARVESGILELEMFDCGMSEARQKLAKRRALQAATRAIDEVQLMLQEEVDAAL